MKLLYVTTVGMTMCFFQPLIQNLLNSDNTVDIACNEATSKIPDCYRQWRCDIFPISWERSPFSSGNLKAIKQIRNIVNEGHYDIVHCHTPIAAACTRIACRKARKNGVKVIYTAHGFHFYKGAPLKNWLIYYPIEKLCSHWTDVLITINTEDYAFAKKRMKAHRVEYVPGVGVDLSKYCRLGINKAKKRSEIGVPEDAILLLSVGELNGNKNHETVIRALSQLADKNIYYVVAGKGERAERLIEVANEVGVSDRFRLLGFRNDVNELLEIADVYILPSFREGLNVSLMEAMAKGLPCVVGRIRGNVDLIDEKGGYLFSPNSISECKIVIRKLLNSDRIAEGNYNREKIQKFGANTVQVRLKEIYNTLAM